MVYFTLHVVLMPGCELSCSQTLQLAPTQGVLILLFVWVNFMVRPVSFFSEVCFDFYQVPDKSVFIFHHQPLYANFSTMEVVLIVEKLC